MSRADLLAAPAMDAGFVSHVRFVEPEDAEFICRLRADPALNSHISHSSPDVVAQRHWIERYKTREAAGEEYYFVIRHRGADLGVVRIYDFQGTSFCWGSWIILPTRPPGLVTFSAVLIYEMGFDCLGFAQSHFDVRLENRKVIDFHLRSGAEPTESNDLDQFFVFPRAIWPAFRTASAEQIAQHRLRIG